jgi:hypothetical protein
LFGLQNNWQHKIIILLGGLFLSELSQAQRIANFNLSQVNNAVNTRFTLVTGVECYGYKILHSLDSINYSEVYDYPGVCGDSGTDETYSNLHENPTANKLNYYKVQLSTIETSAALSIFVFSSENGQIAIYPNPVHTNTHNLKVRISNLNNVEIKAEIYNQWGKLVSTSALFLSGAGASIDIANFETGMYFLRVWDRNKVYKKTFFVEN